MTDAPRGVNLRASCGVSLFFRPKTSISTSKTPQTPAPERVVPILNGFPRGVRASSPGVFAGFYGRVPVPGRVGTPSLEGARAISRFRAFRARGVGIPGRVGTPAHVRIPGLRDEECRDNVDSIPINPIPFRSTLVASLGFRTTRWKRLSGGSWKAHRKGGCGCERPPLGRRTNPQSHAFRRSSS